MTSVANTGINDIWFYAWAEIPLTRVFEPLLSLVDRAESTHDRVLKIVILKVLTDFFSGPTCQYLGVIKT